MRMRQIFRLMQWHILATIGIWVVYIIFNSVQLLRQLLHSVHNQECRRLPRFRRLAQFCALISLPTVVGGGVDPCFADANFNIGNLSTTNTMKLSIVSPWKDVTLKLLVPGIVGPPRRKCQVLDVPAKEADFAIHLFSHNQPPLKMSFVAVADPNTQMTCVMFWNATDPNSFYVSDKSGIKSYSVLFNLFSSNCFFQIPTAKGSVQAAIARFEAEFDDQKVKAAMMQPDHLLALGGAAPKYYFSEAPMPDAQLVPAIVETVDITDGIMRLSLRNPETKVPAIFWIDLKSWKIIESVVDGQQMDLSATGKL